MSDDNFVLNRKYRSIDLFFNLLIICKCCVIIWRECDILRQQCQLKCLVQHWKCVINASIDQRRALLKSCVRAHWRRRRIQGVQSGHAPPPIRPWPPPVRQSGHKISKIGATRYQILRLKCTKFDFRGGSLRRFPSPLAVFKGDYL